MWARTLGCYSLLGPPLFNNIRTLLVLLNTVIVYTMYCRIIKQTKNNTLDWQRDQVCI